MAAVTRVGDGSSDDDGSDDGRELVMVAAVIARERAPLARGFPSCTPHQNVSLRATRTAGLIQSGMRCVKLYPLA